MENECGKPSYSILLQEREREEREKPAIGLDSPDCENRKSEAEMFF